MPKRWLCPLFFSVALVFGWSIWFASGNGVHSIRAQDASDNPNITAEVPQSAPPGVSQEAWDKESEHCKEIGAEMERRLSLPTDQLHGLPSIHSEWETCAHRFAPVQNPYWPPRPIYKNTIPPVAMPTATLPSNASGRPSAGSNAAPRQSGTRLLPQPPPPEPDFYNPSEPEPAASLTPHFFFGPSSWPAPPSSKD